LPQVTNVICAEEETEPVSPRSETSLQEKYFLPLKHRAGKMLKLLDLSKEKAQQFSWTDSPRLWVLLIRSCCFAPLMVAADWSHSYPPGPRLKY